MDNQKPSLSKDVFSSFHQLAQAHPQFEDAQMLVGASDAKASLQRKVIRRSVDAEWINVIEEALPYLDLVIRQPFRAIEDVEEVIPVELSRRISEKSIKHLAQHTNLILKIEGDEITPSKILNVYREETLITYENKFTNTLINRLFAFVDRRYQVLKQGAGAEQKYALDYTTQFHHQEENDARTGVEVGLHMELTTPMTGHMSQQDKDNSENYRRQMERVERIYNTVLAYMSSDFVKALGKNYIRPPVIRTNAILKNKNMNVCLGLWEYIEGCEKTGYTVSEDAYSEMPSDQYIRQLYSSIALQYVQFYNGVTQRQDNRLLSESHKSEVVPDFDTLNFLEEEEDFNVYDTQYHKMVPVSRLLSNRKKLSEQESKIKKAIDLAIKADKAIEARRLAEEAERRRIAEEEERRRKAEIEEARRKAEEEEARRIAEAEERRRIAEEEKRRREEAEAEARRLAKEAEEKRLAQEAEEKRKAEEEKRLAREAEEKRLAREARLKQEKAEAEAKLLAAQALEEAELLAQEQQIITQAIAAEARRIAREQEESRKAEEAERAQIAREVQAIFREQAEENQRLAHQAQAHRAAAEEKEKQLEQAAQVRREAEQNALQQAEEAEQARIAENRRIAQQEKQQRQAAAEHPDYYYSREEYLSLPRKKKKKIQTDLRRLQDYEAKAGGRTSGSGPFTGTYWEEIRRWERSIKQGKK